jgi:hypothetical protein
MSAIDEENSGVINENTETAEVAETVNNSETVSSEEVVNNEELNSEKVVNSEDISDDTARQSLLQESTDANQTHINTMNRQVYNLEREMLLGQGVNKATAAMSNWTKVFLTALSVLLPGIGQIIGIIAGLIFVSSDINSDKKTFGAALLTVSVIAFVIMAAFWFILILAVSPDFGF